LRGRSALSARPRGGPLLDPAAAGSGRRARDLPRRVAQPQPDGVAGTPRDALRGDPRLVRAQAGRRRRTGRGRGPGRLRRDLAAPPDLQLEDVRPVVVAGRVEALALLVQALRV